MQIKKYIVALALLLPLLSGTVRAQGSPPEICSGDTGIAYYVQGFENSTFEWTVEGGTVTRDYNDSIIVDWNVEPGEYNISVLETSEFGCIGSPQSAVVIIRGPDINLGEDNYICDGSVFEIVPDGDFYSYLWHDGSTEPSYITDQEGWIRVEVTDEYGCALSDSMYLTVMDLPEVDLGNDTALCGEESLILDAGTDGMSYTWSTGDIGQYLTVYQGEQEYWVEVEDAYGCLNRDTMLMEDCNAQFYFRDIPTAITPNDDGINDVWNIEKLGAYSQATVEIYDQWGTLVWISEPGYPMPWDGLDMNGRKVPVDSYHFVISFEDGTNERYIGYVTVIR